MYLNPVTAAIAFRQADVSELLLLVSQMAQGIADLRSEMTIGFAANKVRRGSPFYTCIGFLPDH